MENFTKIYLIFHSMIYLHLLSFSEVRTLCLTIAAFSIYLRKLHKSKGEKFCVSSSW